MPSWEAVKMTIRPVGMARRLRRFRRIWRTHFRYFAALDGRVSAARSVWDLAGSDLFVGGHRCEWPSGPAASRPHRRR